MTALLIVRPNEEKEESFIISEGIQTLGKAKDNDIVIDDDSLSEHHLKIEEKEGHYFITDLGSREGTYLNGQKIGKDLLGNGDIIQAGRIKMLFKEERRDLTLLPGATICPSCGVQLSQGVAFCPQCGSSVGGVPSYPSPEVFIRPVGRGAGILPLISLICGIFGPLLLGLGWMVAIILGFFSLSIIRRRGGFARDRRMAVWGINLGFIWMVIIGLWIAVISLRPVVANRISANEDSALISLRNIALCQRFVKLSFLLDKDADKRSEYGQFEDLKKVDFPYFDSQLVSGMKDGYRFTILEAGEERFFCRAVPLHYRWTGRRTFSVDETGVLRGADIKRTAITEIKTRLPDISEGKSVFKDYYNEIANDLLEAARKEAGKKDYEKSQRILKAIRENYPASAACQALDSLEKTINPFLIEQRGKEAYARALGALNEGNEQQALAILKDIKQNQPTCSLIGQVEEEILKIEGQLEQTREARAKHLFGEAQDLQSKGEYEEALKRYGQLSKELSSTSYFEKVAPLISSLRGEAEEKLAEGYLDQILNLSVEDDYQKISRLINLLMTTYPDSKVVAENSSLLEDLETRSIAQGYKKRALEEMEREHYQIALTILERAVYKNPDLKKDLKDALENCYLRMGELNYKKKIYRAAVEANEDYLRLEPAESKLNERELMDAYWQLAKLDYEADNPEAAERSLRRSMKFFEGEEEFIHLLAKTLFKQKKYDESAIYFSRCLDFNRDKVDYYQKLGLSRIGTALEREYELEYLLEGLRKDVINIIVKAISSIDSERLRMVPLLKKRGSYEAKIEKTQLLAQFQDEVIKIGGQIKENNNEKEEILSKMSKIEERLRNGIEHLERAGEMGSLTEDLKQVINLSRRKLSLFSQASQKLQVSFKREITLQERGFRYLERSLSNFRDERKGFETTVDATSLESLLDRTILRTKVEGEHLIKETREIKIPLEVRKQFPIKTVIKLDKEKYRVGEPLIIEFILLNVFRGEVNISLSPTSWADSLEIKDEQGRRLLLSKTKKSVPQKLESSFASLGSSERYSYRENVGSWPEEGRYRIKWTYKNIDSGTSDAKVWTGEAISETVIVKVSPAIEGGMTERGEETKEDTESEENELLLRVEKAIEEGMSEAIEKSTHKESKEKESE